ncbi:MAG: DICT sensory domain-containing protein, partial [Microcystaceae cyanobacterium]
MSLPTTAHLSLLQVIQRAEPTLEPGEISALNGGGLVQSLLQTCRDQGITAQVWCKLPDSWDWWNAIADYSQSGLATQIYLCQTEKKSLKREIVG